MSQSIKPGIAAVFVHVTDVPRAVAWYGRVFDIAMPPLPPTNFYLLRWLQSSGATNIIFQQCETVAPSAQVLWSIGSSAIEATYTCLREQGVDIQGEIMREDGTQTFLFKDLDGNLLMMCEA